MIFPYRLYCYFSLMPSTENFRMLWHVWWQVVGYCGRQTYRQWTCNSWWSFSCIIVSCIWAFVAVAVGANIYGGHINPAVTFGAFIGGNITLLRSIFYWIAHLVGSVVACILLNFSSGGMVNHPFLSFKHSYHINM